MRRGHWDDCEVTDSERQHPAWPYSSQCSRVIRTLAFRISEGFFLTLLPLPHTSLAPETRACRFPCRRLFFTVNHTPYRRLRICSVSDTKNLFCPTLSSRNLCLSPKLNDRNAVWHGGSDICAFPWHHWAFLLSGGALRSLLLGLAKQNLFTRLEWPPGSLAAGASWPPAPRNSPRPGPFHTCPLSHSSCLVPWKSRLLCTLTLLPMLVPGLTGISSYLWGKIKYLLSFYFSSLIRLIANSSALISHWLPPFPKVQTEGLSKRQSLSSEPWDSPMAGDSSPAKLLPLTGPYFLTRHPELSAAASPAPHRCHGRCRYPPQTEKWIPLSPQQKGFPKSSQTSRHWAKGTGMELIPLQLSFFFSFFHSLLFICSWLRESDHISAGVIQKNQRWKA